MVEVEAEAEEEEEEVEGGDDGVTNTHAHTRSAIGEEF